MITERIVTNPNRRRIIKKTPPSGSTNTDGDFYADVSIADEGTVEQPGTLITAELLNNFVTKDSLYPVGSIYMSVNPANPQTLFGGTWVRRANGRTLIGVDETDADFNQAKKTGGAKTHTHSLENDGAYAQLGITWMSGPGNIIAAHGSPAYFQANMRMSGLPGYSYTATNCNAARLGGNTDVGSSLQPYFTCYIWERTA